MRYAVIASCLCLFAFAAQAEDNEYYRKLRPACAQAHATMREFNDGCADQCGTADGGCTAVMTEHCDCGEGRCWNTEAARCEAGESAEDTVRRLTGK